MLPLIDAFHATVLLQALKCRLQMQTHRDADIDSDLNTANERLAAAESNLASLRSAAATGTTLKQKLLISQAEEHVAELRNTQQVSHALCCAACILRLRALV